MKSIKNKIFYITLLLFALTGSFYWYEWRPSEIKKQCSFVKRHKDAVTYAPAYVPIKTYEETGNGFNPNTYMASLPQGERKAQPARDWIEPATPTEYNQCLHSNGL